MPGLIVIDGPDGCGKTTLAKTLLSKEAGIYLHLGQADDAWGHQTENLWKAITTCHEQLVVVDRLWMSEQVYAKVYRDGSTLPHDARALDRIIRKHAGLYVLAIPSDDDALEARFNGLRFERPEMYSDGIRQVWLGYKNLYSGSADGYPTDYAGDIGWAQDGLKHRDDVMLYDLDIETPDQGALRALAFLSDWRRRQYAPALSMDSWNLTGHLASAKVLFVGERPPSLEKVNMSEQPWKASPFYSNVACSAYLNYMLHLNKFDESTAMFTNSLANDGTDHLRNLISAGLVPIALGRKALKRVVDVTDGEYHYLPHPSYWSRFRYRERKEYSYMLDKILYSLSN